MVTCEQLHDLFPFINFIMLMVIFAVCAWYAFTRRAPTIDLHVVTKLHDDIAEQRGTIVRLSQRAIHAEELLKKLRADDEGSGEKGD